MTRPSPQRHLERLLLVSLLLLTALWVVDALLDMHVRNSATLVEAIRAEPYEILLRVLSLLLLAGIGWQLWRSLRANRRLTADLIAARDQACLARERSDRVLAALGDSVGIVTPEFRVLYQNQAHQQLTGGDHSGDLCYRSFAREESVCRDCPVAATFADGKVHRLEKTLAGNGPVSHIEILATPLHNAAGEIVAGVEVVRDISRRKAQEDAVALHARFLQQLIDTIPSPIFYKDREGRYQGCNQAFQQLLGVSREAVVGRRVEELAPAELAAHYRRRDEELLRAGGTQVYEEQVRAGDGTFHDVLFSKAVYGPEGEPPAGLVGVMVDLSSSKAAEREIRSLNRELQRQAAELAASNRELEAFGYSLSHDLHTPLCRVSLAAEVLEDQYFRSLDENGQFCLVRIREGCEAMERLTEAMLRLSHATRGDLKAEPVDLGALVREIMGQIDPGDGDRRSEFRCSDGPLVTGDGQLLRVMLENLLGNAWKYTAERSLARIEFGWRRQESEFVCWLGDNGVGFDMAGAEDLFQPFQRLHPKDRYPGAGIGLATVRRVVERHGGRVWAESAPGEGACFYFALPGGGD